MRFVVKRDEFLKALLIAGRAVNSKNSAVAVLADLKLELTDEGLVITGSNYELTIQTKIPYSINDAEIIRNAEQGAVLVDTKIITDIARKIDSEEIKVEVVDSTIILINGGDFKTDLHGVKADEYPDVDLDNDGTKIRLSKNEFSALVSQTAFAASTKEQRPILTALHLEARDGLLKATATDSARMAKKAIPVDSNITLVANVPAKMMVEVDHLLEGSDFVDISISDKKALFEFENTVVATRLVAGEYPNTENIVPRVTNASLEVNASDLAKAISRVNILSIDRENVVELRLSPERVEVTAKSSQVGSATEAIKTFRFEGINLRISFNSEFVLSAIRALGCEDVKLLFVKEMAPFVIKNEDDQSVVHVVTPLRSY